MYNLNWIQIGWLSAYASQLNVKRFCLPRLFYSDVWLVLEERCYHDNIRTQKTENNNWTRKEKRACELEQWERRRKRVVPFSLLFFHRALECVPLPFPPPPPPTSPPTPISIFSEYWRGQTLYHEILDHTMENSAFVTITKLKGERKRILSLSKIRGGTPRKIMLGCAAPFLKP